MNLKVGIIGCGNIAQKHIHCIAKHVNKYDIAVCDKDELRLNDFADKNAIEHRFGDLATMLKEFKPDVVHILTPVPIHKTIAIACLENGCHVLIEKPMCLSVEEADEIIQIAQKKKLLVCVDHMRLFDPLIIKVRKLLESGTLGSIVNISAGYSYDFLQKMDTYPAIRWIKDLPGGTFFDVMPHPLCLLEEFMPGLVVEKSIFKKNKEGLITDLLTIFRAPSGTATLHMSLNIFPLKNYVEFECNKGIIRVDFRNFLITIRRLYKLPNAIERIVGNLSVGMQTLGDSIASIFSFILGKLDPYAGIDYIVEHFYQAITEKGVSPVTAEKAKRLLELTETIFQGIKEKKQEGSGRAALLKESEVLVTGGTGFIGRRLVNRLLEKGYKVRVLTHRTITDEQYRSIFQREVDVFQGDIYNYEDLEKACTGIKTVYHAAAAMKGDWNYHLDTTITGTKNLLDAAIKMGVKHFVYVSTLNVYNATRYPLGNSINEDFPYEENPEKRGSYSHAKLRAEEIVREYAEKNTISISILRPGLVYGPGKASFLKDAGIKISKKMVVVLSGGWRKIPLVYVDNLVDALVMAGEGKDKARGIFNIVDGGYPTQRKFIAVYKKLTGEHFVTIYVPYFFVYSGFWMLEQIVSLLLRKKVSLCYRLNCINRNVRHSTERIKKQLGWSPRVGFEEGLRLAIVDEQRE